MQPTHFLPPATLAPYIAFYGIIDVPEGFVEPYISPPLGLSGFVICLEGESNAKLNGKLFIENNYCATGQVTSPMIGEIRGKMRSILVFVHPCGMYQLFGTDMSLLTNSSLSLSELLGDEDADRLIRQLQAAADDEMIIQVLNDFFLARQPLFEIAPKVKLAIEYIHHHRGNVTVRDIERHCFITPRSLERYFRLYVGLSPKDYAKIFRFKCLMNYMRVNPGIAWPTLCEQNGYYDQSHLTRYFTRYLTVKPNEMVNLDLEFINYLLQ